MKTEAYLFGGVAFFFFATDVVYAWFSSEPAGTAALTVSFVMSSLICFFCTMNYRRKGLRPEDRRDADIIERAGPLDFFPPHSAYAPMTALGVALTATGVVFGLWLFIIGFGVLAGGLFGLVFQFAGREE